jgi:hypothetical protein
MPDPAKDGLVKELIQGLVAAFEAMSKPRTPIWPFPMELDRIGPRTGPVGAATGHLRSRRGCSFHLGARRYMKD